MASVGSNVVIKMTADASQVDLGMKRAVEVSLICQNGFKRCRSIGVAAFLAAGQRARIAAQIRQLHTHLLRKTRSVRFVWHLSLQFF